MPKIHVCALLAAALLLSCDRNAPESATGSAETVVIAPRILLESGRTLPAVDSVRVTVLNANSPGAAPYYERMIPWDAHGDTIRGIPSNASVKLLIDGEAVQVDGSRAVWWSGSATASFAGTQNVSVQSLPVPVVIGDTAAPEIVGRVGDTIENTDSIVRLSWKLVDDSAYVAVVDGDTVRSAPDSVRWSSPWKDGWIRRVVASFRDKTGNIRFDTVTVSRRKRVGMPRLSVPAGAYSDTIRVAISDSTNGATIRYSIDGGVSWRDYDTALLLGSDTRLSVRATKPGMTASELVSAVYEVRAGTPVFSVPAGTSSLDPLVIGLSSSTKGGTIEWSTDSGRTWKRYGDSIFVGRSTHLVARTVKQGLTTSPLAEASYKVVISEPVIPVASGEYTDYVIDTIALGASGTKGAQIRYTLDGSDPTSASALCEAPLRIDTSCILKVRSFRDGMDSSAVVSASYQLHVAAPVLSTSPGTFRDLQTIRFRSETTGALFEYSRDNGATWASGDSVVLGRTTQLWVRSSKKGLGASTPVKGLYVFSISTPRIHLASGTFVNYPKVAVSYAGVPTSGAVFRYTTDGSDPTSASRQYVDSILIDSSCVLKVGVFKPGMDSSAVVSARYDLHVAAPSLYLSSAGPNDLLTVLFRSETSEASYEYSLDSATWKTGDRVVLGRPSSVWARAVKKGMVASTLAKGSYYVAISPPTISLGSGTYNDHQTVDLGYAGVATPGAEIRYTLDGSDPTPSSRLYTGALLIDTTCVLKARSFKEGMEPSAVVSSSYVLVVSTPALSSTSIRSSNDPLTVRFTCATPGATLWYSKDSATWTAGDSVILNRTTSLWVRATKKGMQTSDWAKGGYGFAITYPVIGLGAGVYDNPRKVAVRLAQNVNGAVIRYTLDGTEPTSSSQAYSDSIAIDTSCTLKARVFKEGMDSSDVVSARYDLVVGKPVLSIPGITLSSDLVNVRFTSTTTNAVLQYSQDSVSWKIGDSIVLGKAASLWVRASRKGMEPSSIVKGVYSFRISSPVIGVVSGTYDNYQTVVVSKTAPVTPNLQLRYTLDGSDPTSIAPLYTAALAINTHTQLNVRAFKDGMDSSGVVSASYRLVVAKPLVTVSQAGASTLATSTNGATIQYSLDTGRTWIDYAGSLSVPSGTELQARASKAGMDTSETIKVAELVRLLPPTISYATEPGSVSSTCSNCVTSDDKVTVTLASSIPGVGFEYTIDTGRTWVATNGVFVLASTGRYKLLARTTRPGFVPSLPTIDNYVQITYAAPVITPAAGLYSSSPTIAMTTSTRGGEIYYTMDGTMPTAASNRYTGPFTVPDDATTPIAAVTIKNGGSSIRTATVFVVKSGSGSSSSIPWNESITYGEIVDDRDGQSYRTTMIGSRRWLAQNLNYSGSAAHPDSIGNCKDSITDSCGKYGRFYSWAEANGLPASANLSGSGTTAPRKGLCMDGWHVPSPSEWGNVQTISSAPKTWFSMNGWEVRAWIGLPTGATDSAVQYVNNNGADPYGFRVVPSMDGRQAAVFWTSTESGSMATGFYFSTYNTMIFATDKAKTLRFPIRCIADTP